MESTYINEGVATWMKTKSPAEMEKLLNCLRSTAKHYQYRDVLLVDAKGQVLLSVTGRGGRLHEEAGKVLNDALRQRQARLTNLHHGGGNLYIHLDVIAPIFADGAETGEALGAVILQCDAEQYLYPLITSWPVPSVSGETVFFSRDGDDVLYLSKLRFQKDAALNLRIPLTHREVPAVMAVLGKRGIMEGKDYRGVEVLSFLLAVPDSPWFLLVKQDKAEVFAPLRQEARATVAFVALLILILALAFGFIWQQLASAQEVRLLNQLLEQRVNERTFELAETKALLQAALDHSQAGIAIADAPAGKLRYVNHAGLLIGGATEAELVAGVEVNQYVASWKLFNLDGAPLAKDEVPLVRAILFGEQCTREFIIRRAEHDDRIVLANAAPIRNPMGAVTAAIVVFLDITEQKRAEELLRQSAKVLRARNEELIRINRFMTGRELRVIELKQQVNDLAAQFGQPRPYLLAFMDAAAAEILRATPKPGEPELEVRGQKSEVYETPKETSP
jgi:PAS domain S-box-containing protein